MARPVIGAHFGYLALDKACGGKAVEGLAFLEGKRGKEGGEMEKIEIQTVQDEL